MVFSARFPFGGNLRGVVLVLAGLCYLASDNGRLFYRLLLEGVTFSRYWHLLIITVGALVVAVHPVDIVVVVVKVRLPDQVAVHQLAVVLFPLLLLSL